MHWRNSRIFCEFPISPWDTSINLHTSGAPRSREGWLVMDSSLARCQASPFELHKDRLVLSRDIASLRLTTPSTCDSMHWMARGTSGYCPGKDWATLRCRTDITLSAGCTGGINGPQALVSNCSAIIRYPPALGDLNHLWSLLSKSVETQPPDWRIVQH